MTMVSRSSAASAVGACAWPIVTGSSSSSPGRFSVIASSAARATCASLRISIRHPVSERRDLQLKESPDQTRVRPRYDHLRTLRCVPSLQHVHFDPVVEPVRLRLHLLLSRQQRIQLAEADDDVAALATLNRTRYD